MYVLKRDLTNKKARPLTKRSRKPAQESIAKLNNYIKTRKTKQTIIECLQ